MRKSESRFCNSSAFAHLPMDLSKFTEKSQAALQDAQKIAMRNQHQLVDVEHLMLGCWNRKAA